MSVFSRPLQTNVALKVLEKSAGDVPGSGEAPWRNADPRIRPWHLPFTFGLLHLTRSPYPAIWPERKDPKVLLGR